MNEIIDSEFKFEMNVDSMIISPLIDSSKLYMRRHNDQTKEIRNKQRQERKLSKSYWKSRFDKNRNKRSLQKWNKQYLLSINGY